MEHMESVEEATERVEELARNDVGKDLDSALEQENEDCELEIETEHPQFTIKDPENLASDMHSNKADKIFKSIELYEDSRINEMTMNLDREQRMVLDTRK